MYSDGTPSTFLRQDVYPLEMPPEPSDLDLAGVAALAEPVRRQLYDVVAGADAAVSREQAAQGAGVAVHTAKFHLDRLVDEGLLEVEYRRLTGRTGPGSGRPAKLYRRSDRELAVSLPARQYDLLSRILATAVAAATASGEPRGRRGRHRRSRRGHAVRPASSVARAVGAATPCRSPRGRRLRAAGRRRHARAAQLPVPPGGPGADGPRLRAQPRVRRRRPRGARLRRRRDVAGPGPGQLLRHCASQRYWSR